MMVSIIGYSQTNDWQYLGRLSVHYGEPEGYDAYNEPRLGAQLYSMFDGEKINYKIVVGQEVITAIPNPEYNQQEYEEYLHSNYMKRRSLPNKKLYSYSAGKYRFNPSEAVLK